MAGMSLSERLESFNLEVEVWKSRLKKNGITKVEQLKAIDSKIAFDLLLQTRSESETNALKECINIDENIYRNYIRLKDYLKTFRLDPRKWLKKLYGHSIYNVNELSSITDSEIDNLTKHEVQDKEKLSKCAKMAAKSLDVRLKKYGLSPEFWLEHFEKLRLTELSHSIQESEFEEILKSAKQKRKIENWEQKRLHDCLGLPDPNREGPDLKDIKENLEHIEDELDKSNAKGLEYMKHKMEQNTDFQSQWTELKQPTTENLNDPTLYVASAFPSDTDTDENLVRHISAGLILKGYYLSKDKLESTVCKQTILKSPEKVTLSYPSMPEQLFEDEQYSRQEAEAFQHALEHGGHSMAISVKGGGWGMKAEANIGYKRDTSDENKEIQRSRETYVSKTHCCFVPTKSFSLNYDDHQLSTAARKALTEIETLLHGSKFIFNRRCQSFFSKFGSHYYIGTYHLGGIYQWSATCESNGKIAKAKAMKMCQKALRANFTGGYNGFGYSVSGGVSGSYHSADSSKKETESFDEKSSVKTRMSKFGGPQGSDNLLDWTRGLVSNRSTWTVIDKGDLSAENYHGVWKLIQNNSASFKDPLALALALKEAWESLTGLHEDDADDFLYINLLDEVMTDLLREVSLKNKEQTLHMLRRIDEITEKLNRMFESNDIWVRKVEEQSNVRTCLEQLLKDSESNDIKFHSGKLLSRLKTSLKNVASIDTLIGKLTSAYTQFIYTDINNCQEMLTVRKEVTKDVSDALKAFLQEDLLQFLFLNTPLKKQQFNFSDMTFAQYLSENRVESLRTDAVDCFDDFRKFSRIVRGTVDTDHCTDCLQRIVNSLEAVLECTEFFHNCKECLGKDSRIQDFVEVVARHLPHIKDDKKNLVRKLLNRLIESDIGIVGEKTYIVSLLKERTEPATSKYSSDDIYLGIPVILDERKPNLECGQT